jgi:hypothetical protein
MMIPAIAPTATSTPAAPEDRPNSSSMSGIAGVTSVLERIPVSVTVKMNVNGGRRDITLL